MTGQFEMVATLSIGKKTEKFTPYEEKTYDSGWANRTLKFNGIAGTSRHMLEIKGGCWKDGHGDVKTFGKGTTGADGKRIPGEKLTIKWKDRLRKDAIEEVAEFKRFVLDLEDPGVRKDLESLVQKFKDNSITDEDIKKYGLSSLAEAESALSESASKRHEFITEWDFADCVNKLLANDSYKNTKFLIKGNIETTEYNGNFYTHLFVSRIYKADQSADTYSTANITLYFNNKCLDDGSVHDKGKYYVNAYTFNYDGARKKSIPCPVTVVIPVGEDEKTKKLTALLVKNFTVAKADGRMWKEIGVKINMINGAEVLELTDDMLSENEQELLMIGAITMQDLIRDRGGKVYGDRVQEWVVEGFARGCLSGAKPTTYTDDDFVIQDETEENIFDDDDDIQI
jgi:hypothetical protein